MWSLFYLKNNFCVYIGRVDKDELLVQFGVKSHLVSCFGLSLNEYKKILAQIQRLAWLAIAGAFITTPIAVLGIRPLYIVVEEAAVMSFHGGINR